MERLGDPRAAGILRNRAFLALWSAQILSQVAANATTFSLIVLVGELTKSNTSSSILILFAIVPAVLFGVFAGLVVDRSVRKRDLLAANSLFTFTFNGAFLVGFIILAPVLIALAGYQVLFGVIASMFVGAAVLCLTVPTVAPSAGRMNVEVAGAAVAQTRQGIVEALSYLRQTPPVVWSLVYIALTYMLVAVAGAMAPGFVREVLGLAEKNVV